MKLTNEKTYDLKNKLKTTPASPSRQKESLIETRDTQ